MWVLVVFFFFVRVCVCVCARVLCWFAGFVCACMFVWVLICVFVCRFVCLLVSQFVMFCCLSCWSLYVVALVFRCGAPGFILIWTLCTAGFNAWIEYPKGPCTQIVYTLASMYLYRDYFKANAYTISAHGPLGIGKSFRRGSRRSVAGFLGSRVAALSSANP